MHSNNLIVVRHVVVAADADDRAARHFVDETSVAKETAIQKCVEHPAMSIRSTLAVDTCSFDANVPSYYFEIQLHFRSNSSFQSTKRCGTTTR